MSLIQELQRRNVIRVGLAYAAGGWLLLQISEIVFEAWQLPEAGLQVLIIALAIGLPLVLVLAWVFEWTPEGIKRESEVDRGASVTATTGRRLDRVIIVVLALALGYFALDKFVLRSGTEPTAPGLVEAPSERPADTTGSGAGSASLDLPSDASVAVLPLRSLGAEADGDTFAAGMHDGLLTALAQIDALRVVARSSVMRVADQNLSTGEVAQVLQVATVLEGGVQRAGDQLRVSLQLVDPRTESYLWAETFDRQLTTDNIFDVQNEIARAVTGALAATLTASDEARLSQLPTADLVALETYFQGRALLDERSEASITEAREAFQAAHERDPNFAQALAGEALAILLLRQGGSTYGSIPGAEAVAMAAPLLERAASLAPADADVLAIQGLMAFDLGQLDSSVALLRQSLEINPANGMVYSWLLNSLAEAGDLEPRLALVREMVKRDPTSILSLFNGIGHLVAHRAGAPGEVEALQARLNVLDPVWGLSSESVTLRVLGDVTGSIREGLRVLEVDPGTTQMRDLLAFELLRYGLVDEARLMAA
ncbi:MAG: hypothetical protein AAGH19_06300, partial [Pseudomonadota bacterium]